MDTKNILVGLFDDDAVFLKAIKEIRSEGVRIDDAFMPFPVHGFEEALGMKETKLHVGGFWMGLTGLTLFTIFIFTTTNPQIPGFSWPNNWGGKPDLSILAWVPILFEVTVLSAAVSMFFAFIIRNTLYPGKKPIVFDERLTDHMFAITFDMSNMDESKMSEVKDMLKTHGSVEIKEAITEKNRLLNIR